jgi:hypothetical protein
VPEELRDLIIRLGAENCRWGIRHVHGEPRRLGHKLSPATVRRTLHAAGQRFVRSAREECTNHLLIFDRGHAEKILHDYARHFNGHRPHQSRDQLPPLDNPNVKPRPQPGSIAGKPSQT